MHAPSAYAHRKRWRGFAEAWDAAIAEAYARIEIALLERGCNLFSVPEDIEPIEDHPIAAMTVAEAIHLLHMHKRQVHALGKAPGQTRAPKRMIEVQGELSHRAEAIERADAIPPALRAADEAAYAARRMSRFSYFPRVTQTGQSWRRTGQARIRKSKSRTRRATALAGGGSPVVRCGRAPAGLSSRASGRRTMRGMGLALALVIVSSPALAGGSKVSSSLALAKQAEKLKPGDWVWAPRIARSGPVLVYVDLGRQLATVYRNGVRIGVTTVSSGKPGHATPTGVFTILQKDPDHHSSKYDDAPMPFQQRLTWEGVAMHAGNLPGYPASHGCVRLPMEFSRLLFGATPMGGTVIIAGQTGDPIKVPAAGVLAPAAAGSAATARLAIEGGQDFSWNPALSPNGPVSVIVSTGDQMVVVLRNGVEIGRTRATVQQRTTDSQVMTLTRTAAGKPEWIQVGVSGLNGPGEIISTVGVERMHVPVAFLTALRSVMTAGTTVLVTEASVSPDSTGGETTVLASEEKAKPQAPVKP